MTPRLGIATAALSGAGHGRLVGTGTVVVVVGEPGRVVVVEPELVVLVVLEGVVFDAEPVAVVVRTRGITRAIPTDITIRTASRSDVRDGVFILLENIGPPVALT
jgi:hypothetical protein